MVLVLLYSVLQIPAVQTWAVKKVAKSLSAELNTRVTIQKVSLRLFNKVELQGLMVEDHARDTLLFAGAARLDLTDWFFFKKKISFQYIGLDDATVNMHRKDSVWNYQFLIDYFAGPKSGDGGGGAELDLEEVHFNNIRFNKTDGWIGQDMMASMKKMDLYMDSVNFDRKQIAIRTLYIEQPLFSQRDYEGNRPDQPDLKNVLAKIPVISAFKWNNSGWVVRMKTFQVFDGTFSNEKNTDRAPYTDRFDGQHLLFSSITGSINNVLFLNDTLSANISLTAKERSGLLVRKLKSHMKFTPELMEFKNLDLAVNNSRLGDYYSMRYEAFNKDMSSFIHNVTLQADFKESVISSDDLAIFAPALQNWKRVFTIKGTAKGTVDNFSTKAMEIRTGDTYVAGELVMRGLPDINTSFIDFKSNDLQTNYADLSSIIPALKHITRPDLPKLGRISYAGNFTGFIRDFVAYGTLQTNLGNITADINMKLPEGRQPYYSGSISTAGFNIGSFIHSDKLGNIALDAKVNGSGFNVNVLKANMNGHIRVLDFAGYRYRNISINGDFEKRLFKGHLSVDDPNLSIKNLDGTLNLSDKEIAFNLEADVQQANLRELKLVKDNVSLAGIFSLNFTGNNIDNFLGTARVYGAVLQHDSTRLSFDSLTLTSQIVDNKKLLTLRSNEIEALINGQFNILELPDAFTVFLSRYYPSYFKLRKTTLNNKQDFSFSVKTNNVDDYIRLFDKKLSGFNNSLVSGNLKLDTYELNVNAAVPEFSYDGKVFTNTALQGKGTRDTLVTAIAIEDVKLNDSLHLPDSKLTVAAANDVSLIRLNTSASKIFGHAELNASVQTLSDGVKIHFYPSSFVINDKKWQLEKDGELTLRKQFIDASEVKFFHEDQEIVISTELDDVTDGTHLVAKLKNVDIRDFAPFVVTKPSLAGLLTGTAIVRDPFGKTMVEFNGTADSFALDGRYIGKLNLDASANTATGLVKFNGNADDSDYVFNIDGTYNYKDSSGNQLDVSFLADKFNINILEPYLGTIFSEMSGMAKGNLKVTGGAGKQYLTGEATLLDDTLKIAYTQCRYFIRNQVIKFGKDLIDIGTVQLRDSLNNQGTVQGRMIHHFFKDFSFEDMRFETKKMLLLNTTKKDNSQFYGNVIGSATMTMEGPVTNLQMNIDGEPSPSDSSHIYLPTGSSKENNAIDYIDFIQFGTEMDNQLARNQAANIIVNMNFTANPACKIDVILDEETGDVIKGQGNGTMSLRVGNKEPLTMRGRYELTRGEYTFNFQTFLKKPFTLSQGSITWNGDPYEAIIDIDAEYLAKNVDLSSLSSVSNTRREDITILSHLSGSLKKPQISFEFKLPETSETTKDYVLVKRLADFNNDENEMYKQVASLLLFNTFIAQDQNFLSQQNTIALATSTVGGVLSGWLTTTFNRELQKATKGVLSTYIDINPGLSVAAVTQLQANVRAGLRILLSSRLNILIGGNLDYNNPYTVQLQRNAVFTPDITIEWLLNKDGSLRVVGFNRTSFDITTAQRNRSGVQLSYRKDFNKLSDILKSRRRLREEDEKKAVPAPVPVIR